MPSFEMSEVPSAIELSVMIKHGFVWTIFYFMLSNFFHDNPSLGFSPKSHGGKTSPTAHRHAAYKFLLIPLIEISSIK